MTTTGYRVTGGPAAQAAIRKAGARIAAAAADASAESAAALAADMRSRAPVGETGALRTDIGVTDTDTGHGAGPLSVDYAPFVEFGTSRQVAQPFAGPAGEAERQRLPGRTAAAIKAAV